MESLRDIVVIYHKHCYDGFGAAWAAWKKFGDTASYLPVGHTEVDVYPEGVTNKEVYVIDFCFSKDVTENLERQNKKLVVLDHHVSSQAVVEQVREHVFSDTDSGAKLAWKYFHPERQAPLLIEYISDSDTWAHTLPSWSEVEGYLHIWELEFDVFEKLEQELEQHFDEVTKKGKLLNKQFDNLVREHLDKAMLVNFDGYEVYAVNASSFLRSKLGHELAHRKGPFSIVYRFDQDVLRLSLRGDGTVSCAEIAEKYGGGGHRNAASIIMKDTTSLPFTRIT